MKSIKVLFAAVALFMGVMQLQAQDAKADKLIAESQKAFKSKKDISGNLTFTIANPALDAPDVKKGTFAMSGNKYQIKFSGEHAYCDGKAVYICLMEEEEVTITEFDPEESLSIDVVYRMSEEDTKSRFDGEDGGMYKISLFWNSDESDFWKAELWLNKTTKLVQKAKMHARNSTTFTYELGSLKTNSGLPESTWKPNLKLEYSDFYINDER